MVVITSHRGSVHTGVNDHLDQRRIGYMRRRPQGLIGIQHFMLDPSLKLNYLVNTD